ncbi:MAG TPA: hypothetical protein VFS52_05560 [Steroidobacteraceae bacterium]|nr:hypothetical protein [Steroidobacteraceae bacterium]
MGNDNWGNSAATMRVLVADQEPEMLEAIARVFEVDVATTKATCIDLLRANHFDVIVACERLEDGSGLELLSQVGQRWPHVIRILAIEPERRAMLRGRLGPFKLFETLSYPIDEQKLEAALERAAEQIAANEAAARSSPARDGFADTASPARPATSAARPAPVGIVNGPRPAAAARPIDSRPLSSSSGNNAGRTLGASSSRAPDPRSAPDRMGRATYASPAAPASPRNEVRRPGDRIAGTAAPVRPAPSAQLPRNTLRASRNAGPAPAASFAGAPKPDTGYPPLPSRRSKIVPLGSPAAGEYRILPHKYDVPMPGTLRGAREDRDSKKASLPEKAASLAAEALSKVSRYIKPHGSELDPEPPRRKRR